MSRIVEKAFDASKKIIRSVFKGSPNLLTTSDVNRQFEAIKHQLDVLDEKTGFLIEEPILTYSLDGGTLKVGFDYDAIEFKGCSFTTERAILTINLTTSAPIAYLCLVADRKELTYEDDATHEIAGAKFEDGTSTPAANQIVYENDRFVLTHSPASLGNLVGIIAQFYYKGGNSVRVTRNWTSSLNSLREEDSVLDDKVSDISKFLGDGSIYRGVWGYFHESIPEITEETYNELSTQQSCTLVKFGPYYIIRLRGLAMEESANAKEAMEDFLCSDLLDAEGRIFIKNVPHSFHPSCFLGAMVGVYPGLQVFNATGAEKVSSVAVYSEYIGLENTQIGGVVSFSLRSRGSHSLDDTSDNLSVSGFGKKGGLYVTLVFSDASIE